MDPRMRGGPGPGGPGPGGPGPGGPGPGGPGGGGALPAELASQEQQLMAQIMNFSEEQIRQLPPDQQQQYWQIRNMAMQQGMG